MRIANPLAVLGEDAACEYLVRKGYKIIERNFRKSHTELDIIAVSHSASSGQVGSGGSPQATLVFIEVKTRSSNSFGTPFDAIPPWKVKNLVKTAQFYKLLNPKLPDVLRIDAIGVYLMGNAIERIEHVENISGF